MSIDPTLQVATLAALENAVNAALVLDPATAGRLQALPEQTFKICCTEPELEIYIINRDNKIELLAHCEQPVTTAIKGPATEYAQLLNASDRGSALINSGLTLQGDSAALIKLQEIISDIELDWEGQLAKLLGDAPAHLLGQTARHIYQWKQQTQAVFLRHLEEFLHEESQLVPAKEEVEHFIDQVQQLSDDTERLEKRINKLKQLIKS